MITLHQFERVWDTPNLSPFCCKVETYLRMAGLQYEVVAAVPPTAPKGKLPYIVDGDETIADSRFIIDHLKQRHHADLDAGLAPLELAQSIAFQRMIEDDLFWSAVMFPRWCQPHNWPANKQAIFGVLPPVVRDVVASWARRRSRRQIRGHGIGLHSPDEIFRLGKRDLGALSDFLADKPFFMGDAPTTLDASAYGLLTNVLWCPIESPTKDHALALRNLVAFCERVRNRFFVDERGAAED